MADPQTAPPNVTDPSKPEAQDGAMKGRVREAIKELKFQTNKKIEKEGEKPRYVPDERPMRMTDVLANKEVNGELVIVTADGRKHRIRMEKAA